MQLGLTPVVVQRNGAFGLIDQCGRSAGAFREVGAEEGDVAQRGRHQQELRVGQRDERGLPRPPAVWFAVVVELVEDDCFGLELSSVSQRS